MKTIDFSKIKTAYFVGIKGVGMTALACVLKKRGIKVDGSDTKEKFFTDEVLKRNNIKFFEGFNEDNINYDRDIFISSSAYLGSSNTENIDADKIKNVEIKQILELKLPLISYAEALGSLTEQSYTIAVSGTHGKSSTTAMIGTIFKKAKLDPSVIAGTKVNEWRANSISGKSKYFIIEADEYREAFLHYQPRILVITSINYDHPDYFCDIRRYKQAFLKLAMQVPKGGIIIGNGDDRNVRDVLKSNNKIKAKVVYFYPKESKIALNLKFPKNPYYNNALAAYYAARVVKIPISAIKESLQNFKGVARRFELIGSYNGNKVIDDYAHHPDEIRATIEGAREKFPAKKILVIFQPHTFSRTVTLMDEFAEALGLADKSIIMPIYASARENAKDWKISSSNLVDIIQKAGKDAKASDGKDIAKTINKLEKNSWIIIMMGATDIWKIGYKIVKKQIL